MPAVYIAPTFGVGFQAFTDGGLPLNGGFIHTYIAGGTTPQATYTTSAGNVQNANPIELDADGRPPDDIWLTSSLYRLDLKDADGNLIRTYDNIYGSYSAASLAASSGASLIGYIEGDSGSVARTVQSRLRDRVSVKDFGATGDGVTNDTAAIQAALSASYGKTLLFPKGDYRVTSKLSVNFTSNYQGIEIDGDSRQARILWYGGNNTSVLEIRGTSSVGFTAGVIVKSISIENSNASTTVEALTIGNVAAGTTAGVCNVCVQNNFIVGFYIGIRTVFESDECDISWNHVIASQFAGIYNDGSSGYSIGTNHVQAYDAGSYGIFSRGTAIGIKSNVVQSGNAPTYAIILDACRGFSIETNYSESPTGATGCIFIQDSTSGYIGANEMDGYPSAILIRIGSGSSDVQIGSNKHGTSGGGVSALIQNDGTANGVRIMGQQTTSGAIATQTGPFIELARESCIQFPLGINSVGGEFRLNEPTNSVNVLAGATTTLFAVAPGAAYLVFIEQATDVYCAAGVVSTPTGGTTALLFKTGSTNANLQIAVSGLNVQAFNGEAATRTVEFAALRIN